MPTCATGRWNNQHGLTLVELGIVLFLISLFSLLSVPLLSGFGENRLDHSARRISGLVKFLFNESALTAAPHRLIIDLDRGLLQSRYKTEIDQWEPLQGMGRAYQLPAGVRIKEVGTSGRQRLTSGTATLEFSPDGWMAETVLHLEQSGKKQLSLQIMPFSAAIEIKEGYHAFDSGLQD
ncbi:MAG: hypothetical protein JXR59_10940 [Desulfuromonadaceae bacterium]|nr:hypothetical protein [Desulfuromonadaceae bacterium]